MCFMEHTPLVCHLKIQFKSAIVTLHGKKKGVTHPTNPKISVSMLFTSFSNISFADSVPIT